MTLSTTRRRVAVEALPVLRVDRRGDRHRLHDLLVDVRLDLDPAANIDPPDPDHLAAAVRALSALHGADEPERFAAVIAHHCVERFGGVIEAAVEVRARGWGRLSIGGRPLDRELTAPADELRMARVLLGPTGERIAAGVRDMTLLTSVITEPAGLALLRLDAVWTYGWTGVPYAAQWQQVRRALTEAWAERSAAGAHLATALCRAVLEESPAVHQVEVRLDVMRRPQVDMTAFGMENTGEVFDGAAPVCGVHEVTVRRDELPE